jgi:hypothetical protein
MIWQGDSPSAAAPPLAETVAAELAAVCRPGDGFGPEQVREIAKAVAAYAADRGADGDARALRVLVSRALHGSGESVLARRVAVLGAGWVRPTAWLVGGEEPVWALDLRALVHGRRERLELTLFTGLRLVVDALAPVWDETGGRGWLGLAYAGAAARIVLGPGVGRRRAAELCGELRGLCVARLETLRAQRHWAAVPGVLNLGD